MTAATTTPPPAIKKDYKGGWKDRTLRNNPASLGQPLTGPKRLSTMWTDIVAPRRPVTVEGVMFSKSGTHAFEICECDEPTGAWFTVDKDRTLHLQDRLYNWGRCRCLPVGAQLTDVPAVHMEKLVTGQALAVVRRIGVADTHELAKFGYEEFGALNGVGPTTVATLRTSIRLAGLPEWRANA